MRRFYNNGTSFIETITKGTPAGGVGSIVKKIVKDKKDKKSRNPDPKTPTMMGTDKKTRDKTEIPKMLSKGDEIKRKKFERKFQKPINKFKAEVKPLRNPKDES